MNKNRLKAIVAIAVAMAFVMPVVVVANDEKSVVGNTSDRANIKNMVSDVFIQDVVLGDGDVFYGYNAYDPSGILQDGPVSFESNNPGNITLLKETTSFEFIAGGTWAVDTWYGCEYITGRLYTIDESTGEMTLIGGGGTDLCGLAYDPTNSIMYGAGCYNLFTIDMDTGTQTFVGSFNISGGLMIAIAFDGKGNLYGVDLGTDNLYSIDPSTGEATLIGPLGININYAQDAAYDIANNILYLSAYVIEPYHGGNLCTCNVITGEVTRVGRFEGGAEITGFAIPYPSVLEIDKITGGFKVGAVVKNKGDEVFPVVHWNISVTGGILGMVNKYTEGTITSFAPGDTESIGTRGILFGLGPVMVTITVSANEDKCTMKAKGFLLLLYLIIPKR